MSNAPSPSTSGCSGPLGLDIEARFETYRETEEVVYLGFGQKFVPGAVPETRLGLRKADGGRHEYYGVGIEHLAFTVESTEEVDGAYQRCLGMNARIHCPPEEEPDLPGYYAFFVFDPDGFRIEVCYTVSIRFAGNGMPESTSRLGRIERATERFPADRPGIRP